MESTNQDGQALGVAAATSVSWGDLERQYRPGLIAEIRARVDGFSLTPEGRQYLRFAAESPSRRVRSTARSLSLAYPSKKMGAVIGGESRTLEGPAIITLEHDDNTIAYFDQAPTVVVESKVNGRKRAYRQTPDFLAVRHDEAVLIECKPITQILDRNKRSPGFYVQDGKRWACPALQEAARKLGMRHEMWTEDSFSPVRLRNLRLVGDYKLRNSELPGYDDAVDALQQFLAVNARASVEDLLKELNDQVCIDHIYAALARGELGFDWDAAPLVEAHRCHVYRDERTRQAFQLSELSRVRDQDRIHGALLEIEQGSLFEWDGVTWRCLNVGQDWVAISHGARNEVLPRAVINDFVKQGVITVAANSELATSHDPEVYTRIAKASQQELRAANLRHTRIARHLTAGNAAPSSRTDRRHLANYRQAQTVYGNGYVGLLPGYARSGNRQPRLIQEVLDIALRHVNERYLTCTNIHKKAVFTLIADECTSKSLPPPSYAWFCRCIDKLPAYDTKLARAGSKGAYPLEPRQDSSENLDQMEPERAFERGHVDHTLTDVETIFGDTSEGLGRCWCTLLIDHVSRRVLAHYLTYDAPSYRSVLMVLRKCVQRHGRLPEEIVVDGGKEFQSVWFETACAIYKIKIVRRPIAKARYGSQIERMFGTTNTNFFHFLKGNTQLRKNVRQMSDEVDPDVHAVWTLPELNAALSQYLYEVYELLEHRELLVTPRFAFNKSMERHGKRPDRRVAFNELFRITTSPAPDKGTAKVQRDGVKIHYLMYYSAQLQRHLGRQLNVRYDPFDKSVAWAYADGQWLRLKSRNRELLRDLTEHDLDLATTEWRKRRSAVEKTRLSEPVLVKFLKEIMETETLLLARKRAIEERRIREQEEDASTWEDDDDGTAEEVDGSTAASTPHAACRPACAPDSNQSVFADCGDDLEILETL